MLPSLALSLLPKSSHEINHFLALKAAVTQSSVDSKIRTGENNITHGVHRCSTYATLILVQTNPIAQPAIKPSGPVMKMPSSGP